MKKKWKAIIDEAIKKWNPTYIVCLFSGGYDSMIATNLMYRHDWGIPMGAWSVDTMLSADGWVEFVKKTGIQLGWNHSVYHNTTGFDRYLKWVSNNGCPYSRRGHKFAYQKLKDHAFAAILQIVKPDYFDKVLFVSGIRKAESRERSKLTDYIQRRGDSNMIFANPLFFWTDEDCLRYRIEKDLPENPFYDTVKGSGDCQCNWGRFIDMDTLKKHSPDLAGGRVLDLHEASLSVKGYGWGEEPIIPKPDNGMNPLINTDDLGEAKLTTPFLCSGCSRSKSKTNKAMEERYLQSGFGW